VRFALPRNVPVHAGRYDWTNIDERFRTFDGRIVSVDTEIVCCSFYNGSSVDAKIRLTYRPNEFFELVPNYQATFIQLPTGNVDIHLLAVDSVINFIPDMQLALQAQFDNISRSFGFSARYRWEYEPGNEIFIGVGHSALIPGTVFQSKTTQLSIRLGHIFRF